MQYRVYEYLEDEAFLRELHEKRTRTTYCKITVLDFATEEVIKEIQGQVTSGSISVNSSSTVRRTLSLSMVADSNYSHLEDIDNLISINKKVFVEIGLKNYDLSKYDYPICWFPCGLFVVASANTAMSTSGWTISITGNDKMVLLNGVAGGTIPASTVFNEQYNIDANGDISIEYPTIYEIIRKSVHQFGEEEYNNIFINDLEQYAFALVKYVGQDPLYMVYMNDEPYSATTDETFAENWKNRVDVYTKGQDIGYKITDFTYPGDLTFAAGSTEAQVLDKIVQTLGNYEYFYDLYGHFVFQEIKNYLNTQSPINELDINDYIKSYSNVKNKYSLTSLDTVTSVQLSPKYDNIKNDFIVWGTKKSASGAEVPICYHLAIDSKPKIDLAAKNLWAWTDKDGMIHYATTKADDNDPPQIDAELIGVPCNEWREELYRQYLCSETKEYSDYDEELDAFWRDLFDTMKEEWKETDGWNPDVYDNPSNLNYWLDFIDSSEAINKYSVRAVGRRSEVKNDAAATSIYLNQVQSLVFEREMDDSIDLDEGWQRFKTNDELDMYLQMSSTGASAFDIIREMLYQKLTYNTTITISCLPRYYLEPNNLIYIENKELGIQGNYVISNFSLPLTYNGTMSITATEQLRRI